MAQHGLVWPPTMLDALPVLQERPYPHTPIRAITAAQYASLHSIYGAADVPDDVLFPFLHGLEGNNLSQKLFFSHSSRASDGSAAPVHVPRYRGLMSVACPLEDDSSSESGDSSDSDSDSELDQLLYDDQHHNSSEPYSDWTNTAVPPTRQHSASISSTTSSSPLSASTTATSIWSDSPPSLSCPAPSLRCSESHRLLSSVTPREILSLTDPAFLPPNIPDGISLRNFGTQVAIYATLSDIVLYSPKGITRSVMDIAERAKQAMETKAIQRNQGQPPEAGSAGFFGNDQIAYNVLVISDPFSEFERHHPDLVAIDSLGNPVQHVDLMMREKEEMRSLTKASLLSDNIYLGNTTDVPVAPMAYPPSELDPFDSSDNTDGYDICIECRDDAYFPTSAHLRQAEDHIYKLETAWNARIVTARTASPPPSHTNGLATTPPPLSPSLLNLNDLHFSNTPGPMREYVRSRSASPPLVDSPRSSHDRSARRSETPPIQARPAPNPSSIIHLAFPSSPSSNSHTISQMMNMLAFLERYTDPASYANTLASTTSSTAASARRRGVSISSSSLSASLSGNSSPMTYRPHFDPQNPLSRPLKILLHSLDGYTETSVLALSYLMKTKKCTLPEAYLELQINRQRSFFVSPGDLGVLKRIESSLTSTNGGAGPGTRRDERERAVRRVKERTISNASLSPPPSISEERSASMMDIHTVEHTEQNASVVSASSNLSDQRPRAASNGNIDYGVTASRRWGAWRSGSFSSFAAPPTTAISMSHDSPTTTNVVQSSTGPNPPFRRARALTSPVMLPSSLNHNAWFTDPRFDGAFPSRILPHLYLGNLNHASNVYMLHALGITHVVSVGECALIPPICPNPSVMEPGGHYSFDTAGISGGEGGYSYNSYKSGSVNSQFVYGSGPGGQGSLWIEEREGRIKVLDIKGVSDDGIDSLRPQFGPIIDWIDRAHQEGGKVLVHCRVGVSRSATVTIAYVMKHLNMSLVDAYLLVRSRRLSILIQPNMRLLYNLVGWEIELAKIKAGQDFADQKGTLSPGGRLSWPFLAREVHRLNERYLS